MNIIRLIFIAAVAVSTSEAPTPKIGYNQDGEAYYYESPPNGHQTDSNESESGVSHAHSESGQDKQQQHGDRDDAPLSASDIINCISTAVIAFFTVVLTIYTALLWTSGEKHSERELRAYVFPETIYLEKSDSFDRVSLRMDIRNSGQTPAYHLRQATRLFIETYPPRQIPALTWREEGGVALGPGGKFDVYIDVVLAPAEWARVITGELCIYISGEIRYTDAFRKEQFTRHRSYYGTGGRPTSGNTLRPVRTEDGNEAT